MAAATGLSPVTPLGRAGSTPAPGTMLAVGEWFSSAFVERLLQFDSAS